MKIDRKINKSPKQLKKLLILTGIYAIFAAIISFFVIFTINNSVVMHADNLSLVKNPYASGSIVNSSGKHEDMKFLLH